MIIIVLCRDYPQFRRFVDYKFPYKRHTASDIVCIDDRRDLNRLDGIERNQVFVDIGADDPALRAYCEARHHIEITLIGGLQ